MIPLSYFLIAWFILLAIFALMSFLSVIQMMRLGTAELGTLLSTGIFLAVAIGVILLTGGFFLTVDWSQNLNLVGNMTTVPLPF